MNRVDEINRYAHINYLHPNRLPWEQARSDEELDFLSRALVGTAGEEEKVTAYLYKELAQLAEIEMHVATVMSRVLCELQSERTSQGEGYSIYNAVSCFASEEINHANSFYQYVRYLSGRDLKLGNNYFEDRVGLYSEGDSPLVKLAALCATVYVGESIITVFERRLKVMDPMHKKFLTKLLHFHGLDEARHVRFDHYVIDEIIPRFSAEQRRRMHQIIGETESLNTQLELTHRFREIVQSGDLIQKVDDHMDADTRELVHQFSQASDVHGVPNLLLTGETT